MISVKRMEEFLLVEEVPLNEEKEDVELSVGAAGVESLSRPGLRMSKASFYWDQSRAQVSEPPTLQDISFEYSKKSGLVCIIGKVGAGKSSFLNVRDALLGSALNFNAILETRPLVVNCFVLTGQ